MTRALNALADVICRAQAAGRRTPMGIALAVESAGMLQSPETAAELERLRKQVAELEAGRPSRFSATPKQVDEHLRRILAEDTYLRYQQAIGGRAVEQAARELRMDANLRQLEGEHEDAAETRKLADLIDPLNGGGPYPSQLLCSQHNGFGPCPGAPWCTPRQDTAVVGAGESRG